MMGNEIHLDNSYIGGAVTMMEDLERRVENFHKTKTYDEILSEAREGVKKISPQEMTLDEYKAYIEGELQNIPRNVTRYRDQVTVVISDAGYEAMQNDSDYEAWVLNGVREELNFPDYLCCYPGTYGRYDVMEFGATKEDFRGHMSAIHKNDSHNNLQEEETYWDRRLKRLKARLKAEQELFEHEMILQKEYETELNKAIQEAKANLNDSQAPEIPITGVPAKFLLSMLDGNS
jgi:predicted  nucleic acid-binding Zn-ribbon protein